MGAKQFLTTTTLILLLVLASTENPQEAPFCLGREKLTHLRFYWHDIFTGPNPTLVQVASAASTNTSKTNFGAVTVIDDPLTERPELTSKLIGRAQGQYIYASSKDAIGLAMAMNFVFVEGKYNGSTLMVMGRNSPLLRVREMAVVGGSGRFRFARGYAQASTYNFDNVTLNANVEYNVFVLHY
ncbi:hypothetical protein QJS04_geneDACA001898 [Acorus gramineus]|uniref:Dirigent protein n=1 Tax=Acorus gramineus TaxID=55184 RepID=A0AAV9BII5_ACOGR|nr:hypothetical protein QJS04_geneDACA001898 [Acorus gramineus]